MHLQRRVQFESTASLRNEYQPCCRQKTKVRTFQALRNATDIWRTFKPTLWAAGSYQGSRVVFVLRRTGVTPDELWENRRTLELCLGLHFFYPSYGYIHHKCLTVGSHDMDSYKLQSSLGSREAAWVGRMNTPELTSSLTHLPLWMRQSAAGQEPRGRYLQILAFLQLLFLVPN